MVVSEKKIAAIRSEMARLEIKEADLDEQFVLGSGKGGQKANKTSSVVRLKHLPTDIVVNCSKERERETNRWIARRDLCEKIAASHGEKTRSQSKIEKIRKQKKRRKRRSEDKECPSQ